jgi:hypothetical protein
MSFTGLLPVGPPAVWKKEVLVAVVQSVWKSDFIFCFGYSVYDIFDLIEIFKLKFFKR